MKADSTRRTILRGGLALAGLGVLSLPDWAVPLLAQGETIVPFTDIPENVRWETPPDRRTLDVRTIDGPFTPADKFATTQHYGHPSVDPATFKLKITGLVNTPKALSLDELKKIGSGDLVVGFECSGNRGPLNGLAGNGRWTGVPLKTVLNTAGLKADAHDLVFFGADHGEEEVEWRTEKYKIDYHFGRSLPRDKALSAEPFLAWALNGAPLSKHQGAPLRLLVPGWYGVANVKWLSEIHAQEEKYVGKYQTRWYRTVRTEMVDGELKVSETEVTHMQLKSFVARVTARGGAHRVLAVVLNDGTPVKSVEIKVDDGAWQTATADTTTKEKFGWKFYTYDWSGATPGDHTIVSRVTDATGLVQPTAEELGSKRSFLETNSQVPRKLRVG
jgi:DMSO/TMAO reductase YedYZ molybdopterin-dependent catalytic subunit